MVSADVSAGGHGVNCRIKSSSLHTFVANVSAAFCTLFLPLKGVFSPICSFGSVGVWSEERVVYGFCGVNVTESNKVKAAVHPAGMAHCL